MAVEKTFDKIRTWDPGAFGAFYLKKISICLRGVSYG
jgi:hypothetical protein